MVLRAVQGLGVSNAKACLKYCKPTSIVHT